MNSTACIYAQKLKHFYVMKTYLCNVSSCLQFSLQVSTTIVQYSRTFEADDAYVNGNA